ncbi:uncharacterized protein LOC129265123 [Lytechinus pictus]|uniref:uncharacterized protein LOC129265123 n=1 Tax=Lytechinus pictus TaxID=7653 RepID=UPI00240D1445|nr:uncharacterized protein LOC129265123 [Lytechinus pictus]
MAPILRSSSRTAQHVAPEVTTADPPFSALTRAGESLFMCSNKEGHTCYHACRGHGRYPLWNDEDLEDDVEEEPEPERKKDDDDVSSSEFESDEEWISDADREGEEQFWREIQESVERTRQERDRRIHYSATDLRFLPEPGRDGSAMEHVREGQGPIVGVVHTKPPPEYVWYLSDDSESWMRGSLPERLSEEPDGLYHRYKYHVWDRIPASEVHESEESDDDDDEYEDEEWEEEMDDDRRSWSDLADQQEQEQNS